MSGNAREAVIASEENEARIEAIENTLPEIQERLRVQRQGLIRQGDQLDMQDRRIAYLEERYVTVSTHVKWERFEYPRDTCFQKRPHIWSALEARLSAHSSAPLVLSGQGGLGKTSLASEWAYAQKENNRYTIVRWMNMGSIHQLSSIQSLARDLNLPYEKKTTQELWEMIAQCIKEQSWLLVFDNVETYAEIQEGLSKFQLHANQSIVITSRDETTWSHAIRVDVYTKEEALTYIAQQMRAVEHPGFEMRTAEILAERLGYHPLALELAMASICLDQITLDVYIERLEQQGLSALDDSTMPAQQSQARHNPHRTLGALWADSLPKLSSDALKLLHFLSFIDVQGGTRGLLLTSFENDEARLNQALRVLRGQSFVKRTEAEENGLRIETWRMHRLLQEVARGDLVQQLGQQQADWETFLQHSWATIKKHFPEEINTTADVADITRGVAHGCAIWTHIHSIAADWSSEMKEGCLLPLKAALFSSVGNGERHLTQFARAKESLHNALIAFKAIYGTTSNHPDIAATLGDLGGVYFSQGDYVRAIEFCEASLAMNRAIHGATSNHPEIAATLGNLGSVYESQGDYVRAIEFFETSLAMERAIYGATSNHPGIAGTLNNLGNVYQFQGDYVRAIEFCEASLAMKRAIYGVTSNHPKIASTLNNLGVVYQFQGDYVRAIEFYEASLAMNRAIYGATSNHPEIAGTLGNLGNVYASQGNDVRAIEFFEASLAMSRAIHGATSNHPEIATTLGNLGAVYESQGDYVRAIEFHEASLAMNRAIHGATSNHPEIAATLNNLGLVYASQGDYVRAIEFYEASLAMKRAIHGATSNHPGIAKTLNNLNTARNIRTCATCCAIVCCCPCATIAVGLQCCGFFKTPVNSKEIEAGNQSSLNNPLLAQTMVR